MFLTNTLGRVCWLTYTSALLLWVAGDAAIKIKKTIPELNDAFATYLDREGSHECLIARGRDGRQQSCLTQQTGTYD